MKAAALSVLLVLAGCGETVPAADPCEVWNDAAVARVIDLITDGAAATIFIDDDGSQADIEALRADAAAIAGVTDVTRETKRQAYARFEILFEHQPALVRGTEPAALPSSFRVYGMDPAIPSLVKGELERRPGVSQIRDEFLVALDVRDGRYGTGQADELLEFWDERGYFEDASGDRVDEPEGCDEPPPSGGSSP